MDITVIGAGPVGLLFAVMLLRRHPGVALRVFDGCVPQAWQPAQLDPRVYALSRESQNYFGGLWDEIAARRVSPYRRMHVFEQDSPDRSAAIVFDAADVGEPDLGHIVEDRLLRSVLLKELGARGAQTCFGAALDRLEMHEGRIGVTLADGARFTADLVVGADGGESAVRDAAGIDFIRKDYVQRAVVAHVTTSEPHRETAWQRFLPEGPLAFLPLADGRSSIVWTHAAATAARLLTLPDSAFLAELETASAGILGRLEGTSPRLAFPLELKHAARYTRPGVVLIGDAAHAVHPLAGQGMNLGLRDAAVLANTLAAALAAGEYPGDEYVLRRYARAQKARNLGMQLAFDGLNELFGRRMPAWVAPVRRAGMTVVNDIMPAKQSLMRRAMGLDTA